jgi:segregation and condensation protein A
MTDALPTEATPAETTPSEGRTPYHVRLDIFEGPLDLLLHLIKEQKLDIYDIPVAHVTEQYLAYLDMMRELNLEIAGEFLLMAATLAHLKSRMLVPPDETQEDAGEEGIDPRAELTRRLLEYQKYKDAAGRLFLRPLLFRDVFVREKEAREAPAGGEPPPELLEVSVFKLVEAFHRLVQTLELRKPHEVAAEQLHVADCVKEIGDAVRASPEGVVRFKDLFRGEITRLRVVVTFMAVLEMLKRGALRAIQSEEFGEIHLMGTPSCMETGSMTDPTMLSAPRLKSAIEALLFLSQRPVALTRLQEILSEAPPADVEAALRELAVDRAGEGSGVELLEIAGGWQFRTKAENAPWIFKLNKARPVRLSRAALETLSIVAYRQPVTRPEVDEIRGVDSGPVLRNLLERNLVKILGKREEPGNPLIYGTTREFLEFFGLRNLADLPTLREYTELGDESRAKLEQMLGPEETAPESPEIPGEPAADADPPA